MESWRFWAAANRSRQGVASHRDRFVSSVVPVNAGPTTVTFSGPATLYPEFPIWTHSSWKMSSNLTSTPGNTSEQMTFSCCSTVVFPARQIQT